MLTRLAVKNFRLLRDVTIDVEPGKPIVLIGPNSSGKSSVLQVLELLQRWAREGLDAGPHIFGGVKAILPPHKEARELAIQIELLVPHRGYLRYELGLERTGSLGREELTLFPQRSLGKQDPVILFKRQAESVLIWNDSAKKQEKIDIEPRDGFVFDILKSPQAYPYLEVLRESLSEIQIYDGFLTTPLWVRDPREGRLSPFDSDFLAPTPRVERRGLNLVNALYHLQSNHPEAWEELMASFQAEFPFVARLEFPADPAGGRIALGWRDRRYPGVRMQGHQMSGGMAAYLCLLAAILSPEPTPVIAFDEPDTQLHPSALRRVVHLLEEAAKRTTIIVATHSDRFLDHLSDPAASLRLCEPSEDGVTIRKVDRDALEAWRSDYTMSELRERGHLDPPNSEGGASS